MNGTRRAIGVGAFIVLALGTAWALEHKASQRERDAAQVEYRADALCLAWYLERRLFELLVLEGAQAGLSWLTILKKREAYRKAFDRFDPRKVARYDARKVARLLADEGIVRNRLKIDAAIANAKAFLAVQREFGSFDAYLWSLAGGAPLVFALACLADVYEAQQRFGEAAAAMTEAASVDPPN